VTDADPGKANLAGGYEIGSPAAMAELAGQLSEKERDALRRLMENSRARSRERLRQAKVAGNAAERDVVLAAISHDALSALDRQVDGIFAAPGNASITAAIACRKGCAFCCHLDVGVTIVEAVSIAQAILSASRPDLVASVIGTAPLLDGLDAPTRQAKRIACPLLRDDACSIYGLRPSACRAYMSFSARECEDDFDSRAATGMGTPVTSFASPRLIAGALTMGVRAACADEGLQSCPVELTAALDRMFRDETAIDRWLAGESVFQPYA
jgi:Fe-S-cluster containining protein